MYRLRTVLMLVLTALGFTVLQTDRELSRQLQRQQDDVEAITADLKHQLEQVRARRQRLNEAAENISAAYSAAECARVGFTEVRCPDSPGVESWADAVAAFVGE